MYRNVRDTADVYLSFFFLGYVSLSVSVSLEWNPHNDRALKGIRATSWTAKVCYCYLTVVIFKKYVLKHEQHW